MKILGRMWRIYRVSTIFFVRRASAVLSIAGLWNRGISDRGMHRRTCVTHVPWCMSRLLTCGGGENVPGIPCACTNRNFAYLEKKAHGVHPNQCCSIGRNKSDWKSNSKPAISFQENACQNAVYAMSTFLCPGEDTTTAVTGGPSPPTEATVPPLKPNTTSTVIGHNITVTTSSTKAVETTTTGQPTTHSSATEKTEPPPESSTTAQPTAEPQSYVSSPGNSKC